MPFCNFTESLYIHIMKYMVIAILSIATWQTSQAQQLLWDDMAATHKHNYHGPVKQVTIIACLANKNNGNWQADTGTKHVTVIKYDKSRWLTSAQGYNQPADGFKTSVQRKKSTRTSIELVKKKWSANQREHPGIIKGVWLKPNIYYVRWMHDDDTLHITASLQIAYDNIHRPEMITEVLTGRRNDVTREWKLKYNGDDITTYEITGGIERETAKDTILLRNNYGDATQVLTATYNNTYFTLKKIVYEYY